MNFSWLPTTWRSTFYGMLPKNFIITCATLGNRRSYMDQNTFLTTEVSKCLQNMLTLRCQDLTGKLITSFILGIYNPVHNTYYPVHFINLLLWL